MGTTDSNTSRNNNSIFPVQADEKNTVNDISPAINSPPTPSNMSPTIESSEPPSPKPEEHKSPMFGRIEMPLWRRVLISLGLCMGILLSVMDTSIMATAIYTIALDFNSLANSFWAVLSYQLSYLGFAVVFARLSDFIGRRVAVVSAFVIFIAFSLASGWSQNINQLIAFRTLQGIGGAGLYALALILMIEVSTVKMMALTSSMIGATIAMSGVLGPIIGGLFTSFVSWRWIFWINGPVGVFALACFVLGWPNNITAYDASKRSFAEFDYIGTILLLSASVLVVFGLQEAGSGQYTWDSSIVLGSIISGCISWVLLFGWEFYVHKRHSQTIASMFPFQVVTFRPMFAAIMSTMLTGFTFFAIIIGLPLRFQLVNLFSPSDAGVHLLPLLCFSGFGSFLAGAVSSKKNNTFPTLMVAGSMMLLGVGLLSTLSPSLSVQSKTYGFEILAGFGLGTTIATVSMMTSLQSDFHTHAVAQGIVSQVRVFGGSIGVAASNAVFQSTCATQLQGLLTPDQIHGLQTNTRILNSLDAAGQEAVRVAYSDSFAQMMRICTYIAAVCLLINALAYQKNPPPVRAQQMQKLASAGAREQKDEEA